MSNTGSGIVKPISVRNATVEDVPFMQAMNWEAILASPILLAQYSLENIQQRQANYWNSWPNHPDPSFIAVDATGRKLGAITVKANDDDEPVSSWRIGIGVVDEARGQRVGQCLIEKAIEFARQSGAQYLNLSVDRTNNRAIALYRRCGFIEKGDWDNMLEMRITFN